LSSVAFSSSSLWNQPVPTGATYTPISWSANEHFTANWASTGVPVYVASSSDPVVQVSVPASEGWPANPTVHIPSGATGSYPPTARWRR
jgi:hypothetical protein